MSPALFLLLRRDADAQNHLTHGKKDNHGRLTARNPSLGTWLPETAIPTFAAQSVRLAIRRLGNQPYATR
jgi:hypothetical protein